MPRRREPPRLYLREDEGAWIIRDGKKSIRTGCRTDDSEGAETALSEYLAGKFVPVKRERDPDQLTVAEVLTAYGREHAPHVKDPGRIGYAIDALLPWWGEKGLSDVRGSTCREYANYRGKSDGTVRRELGVLSAAIGHWHAEHGPLNAVPVVTLPPMPEPKPDWLTRHEAAMLLAGALGWYRDDKGKWRREVYRRSPWVARFILIGLYTGTRPGAINATRWIPNTTGGWPDLDAGVYHRRGAGAVETKKRKPPTRLGSRILTHLRRWNRMDNEARSLAGSNSAFLNIVAYDGRAVEKSRRAWDSAVDLAQLGRRVTPHILRHTRATWLMQAGVDIWEAAGSLGMSPETLRRVYGHHSPDFQRSAAEV